MRSFSAFFKGFLLCLLSIIILCLAVANPQEITIALDPFSEVPRFTVSKPLYQVIFITFLSGVLLGSALIWFQQRKYRRMLRSLKKGHPPYDVDRLALPHAPNDPL